MKQIVVMLPVVVPSGDKCWNYMDSDQLVCSQFDNEGGGGRCLLFRQDLSYNNITGYYKLDECRALKEQK